MKSPVVLKQTNPLPQVKPERTGWRDLGLSQRHRMWGLKLPAVDLDFILLEFDKSQPTALIEYKSELAAEQFPTHPSLVALTHLGNRANLPVFVVRYATNFEWFRIMPLNAVAKKIIPERITVPEREFVSWLYSIRGLSMPDEVLKLLDTTI